jgi:hypothetical protein
LWQSSRQYGIEDCTRISIDLANSRSLILVICKRGNELFWVAVVCSSLLKMLSIFLDFVLHPEHHFYKPFTENWYYCAGKRYNVSQIVIMFLDWELSFQEYPLSELYRNVITIQKWIGWIIITIYINVECFTEPLQRFDLFDQPSDKSTNLQKRYNDSLNHWTLYEALHNDTLYYFLFISAHKELRIFWVGIFNRYNALWSVT